MNSSKYKIGNIMRGSRKFCQRGSNSDKFFFVLFFRGERGAKNHNEQAKFRPTSKTPLKWRFADRPIMAHIECWLCSFVIFRRSRPVILENPILCDFHEPQRSYAGEAQTRGPSVLSQALYHCARGGTWGSGVPWGQKLFFKHGHVTYQIDGDNK